MKNPITAECRSHEYCPNCKTELEIVRCNHTEGFWLLRCKCGFEKKIEIARD